ncbi:metal dependent phosphohydrolase, HD region [Calothrix sp. NIES-4071]|nr:metal dependent phosphohydrolase, HD region [Calothrix sp. NIES-4071]BAZ57322.1 metal dependent phosphohydrolase, HD region [Calothrix sp. NIES-4105]
MKIKAELPRNFLNKEVSAIIEAYFEINHLKQLYRQGWLQRGVPPHLCESVAEHSFCVTLLSLFLADAYFPELDKSKVICMSLLHDIGEIYAGDFTPLDNIKAQVKQNLERKSVQQVLSKLPNSSKYLTLWEECEAGTSPEARFVRQIDRLEMSLQASVYDHQGLLEPTPFFASTEKVVSETNLLKILTELKSLKSGT